MHPKTSNVLTNSQFGNLTAAPVLAPSCLPPHLRRDWDVISSAHQNLLLVGPTAATRAIVQALAPHFRQPVYCCSPLVDAVLPEPVEGTLIVSGVDALRRPQQARMFEWLNRAQTQVQVVCTSVEPVFCIVQAGGFLADLYYRLNVVLLDVTPDDDSRLAPPSKTAARFSI
jgi:hypothetical protein